MTAAFLAAVFGSMVVEATISRRHEGMLRAMGAIEPPDDVYGAMRWAYPLCFVLIAAESRLASGWAATTASIASIASISAAGVVLFGGAKILKWWAMSTLGTRWTFRVLVLPDAPLILGGPYRYLRHPNYLAVVGELAGAAVALRAPVAGVVSVLGFGALMRRRIIVEERVLKLRLRSQKSEVGRDS
jgi:methyltransferase